MSVNVCKLSFGSYLIGVSSVLFGACVSEKMLVEQSHPAAVKAVDLGIPPDSSGIIITGSGFDIVVGEDGSVVWNRIPDDGDIIMLSDLLVSRCASMGLLARLDEAGPLDKSEVGFLLLSSIVHAEAVRAISIAAKAEYLVGDTDEARDYSGDLIKSLLEKVPNLGRYAGNSADAAGDSCPESEPLPLLSRRFVYGGSEVRKVISKYAGSFSGIGAFARYNFYSLLADARVEGVVIGRGNDYSA